MNKTGRVESCSSYNNPFIKEKYKIKRKKYIVRSEVLTLVSWNATPYNLVDRYQRFEKNRYLHLEDSFHHIEGDIRFFFELLVFIYQTRWRPMP